MEAHPFANMFPMMSTSDLDELAADIREHGLKQKIILDQSGRVVDGRNRLAACHLAGVTPEFETIDGGDSNALAVVVSANIRRRHLSESQRADIAARIANVKHGGSRKETCGDTGAVTHATAAKLLNVSERSIRSAAKVHRSGIRELQAVVQRGDLAVSAASRIAELPREQQHAALRRALSGERDRIASELSEAFDRDAAAEFVRTSLRRTFDRWPAKERATLVSVIREIADELHTCVYERAVR